VCEVKPMNFMDVNPYSNAIHSASLRMRAQGHQVQGIQTQTGVSHLKKDGFHILPSFSGSSTGLTHVRSLGPSALSHTILGQVPGPEFEG
jgi:hypothetical protein